MPILMAGNHAPLKANVFCLRAGWTDGSVAAPAMPAKVFISYSTNDLDAVTKAKKVLEAAGHTAYVAEYSAKAGTRLPNDIKKGIQSADVVVVFWSSAARDSAWVDQEMGIAEAHGKTIVPIVLEKGLVPGGFLADRKYLSAVSDPEKTLAEMRSVVEAEKKRLDDRAAKALGVLAGVFLLALAISD